MTASSLLDNMQTTTRQFTKDEPKKNGKWLIVRRPALSFHQFWLRSQAEASKCQFQQTRPFLIHDNLSIRLPFLAASSNAICATTSHCISRITFSPTAASMKLAGERKNFDLQIMTASTACTVVSGTFDDSHGCQIISTQLVQTTDPFKQTVLHAELHISPQ